MLLKCPEHIKCPRVSLRKMVPRDLEPFLQFMADEEATRHLLFTPEQKTREAAAALFETVRASYGTDGEIFVLTVADTRSDEYLGTVGAAPLEEGGFEIFYTLLPGYWGRGYASEAAEALVAYLRDDLDLQPIHAYCGTANPRAHRVAERIGMTREGEVVRGGQSGVKFVLIAD